jgi:hypothetical protein
MLAPPEPNNGAVGHVGTRLSRFRARPQSENRSRWLTRLHRSTNQNLASRVLKINIIPQRYRMVSAGAATYIRYSRTGQTASFLAGYDVAFVGCGFAAKGVVQCLLSALRP